MSRILNKIGVLFNKKELEHVIDNLTLELNESKNFVAALQLENEDLRGKCEDYKREIKQWEVMYKEWMSMMEDRVTNINRTNQILQKVLQPGEKPGVGKDEVSEEEVEFEANDQQSSTTKQPLPKLNNNNNKK